MILQNEEAVKKDRIVRRQLLLNVLLHIYIFLH